MPFVDPLRAAPEASPSRLRKRLLRPLRSLGPLPLRPLRSLRPRPLGSLPLRPFGSLHPRTLGPLHPRPTCVAGQLRRRTRLLITGCGDVGHRVLAQLAPRIAAGRLAVVAVTRDLEQCAAARAQGARALALDLDERAAVRRLGALSLRTIHLAPPPPQGNDDPRLAALIAAHRCSASSTNTRFSFGETRRPPRQAHWVLIGTSGVYGDCAGAEVDETRPIAPRTDRARRRAAAEKRLRAAVRQGTLHGTILRVPGIYAHDRLPLERLRRALPVPTAEEDGYTNHIHADDLARIAWVALYRGLPGRTINAVDDSRLKMGEWFDRVADASGLPRPPRLPRAALAEQLSPVTLSFMSESRRLSNRRLKCELRVRLRWPTVDAALANI